MPAWLGLSSGVAAEWRKPDPFPGNLGILDRDSPTSETIQVNRSCQATKEYLRSPGRTNHGPTMYYLFVIH